MEKEAIANFQSTSKKSTNHYIASGGIGSFALIQRGASVVIDLFTAFLQTASFV